MGTTELSRSGSALTLCCGAGGWERSLHLDLHPISRAAFAAWVSRFPEAGMSFPGRLGFQSLKPSPPVTHAYVKSQRHHRISENRYCHEFGE
jgi:hypothetical protein